MAGKMTTEKAQEIRKGYLGTIEALRKEIEKMESIFNSPLNREEFYSGVTAGRKEVYETAQKLFGAECTPENAVRLQYAGAACAMVAAAKGGREKGLQQQEMITTMKEAFGMSDVSALDALETAKNAGLLRAEDGAYKVAQEATVSGGSKSLA